MAAYHPFPFNQLKSMKKSMKKIMLLAYGTKLSRKIVKPRQIALTKVKSSQTP